MIRLGHALALVSLFCGTLVSEPVSARSTSLRSLGAKRLEAVRRWEASAHSRNDAGNARRATDTSAPAGVKNITFSNPKASGACARVLCAVLSPFLMRFQSSTWTAAAFLWWTLMSARHGLA